MVPGRASGIAGGANQVIPGEVDASPGCRTDAGSAPCRPGSPRGIPSWLDASTPSCPGKPRAASWLLGECVIAGLAASRGSALLHST